MYKKGIFFKIKNTCIAFKYSFSIWPAEKHWQTDKKCKIKQTKQYPTLQNRLKHSMATTALKLGRRQYPSFIAQHQQMVLIN